MERSAPGERKGGCTARSVAQQPAAHGTLEKGKVGGALSRSDCPRLMAQPRRTTVVDLSSARR